MKRSAGYPPAAVWIAGGLIGVLAGSLLPGSILFTEGAGSGAVDRQDDGLTWACPMLCVVLDHPGSCPVCGMELEPFEAGGTDVVLSRHDQEMIGLSIALVEPRELFTSIGATGRIEFDPSGERSVTAWTAGRIERLPVSAEGQEVSPGTILMDIYSPELYVAQQELLVLADGQRLLGEEGLEAAKEKLRLLGVTEVQMERVMESGTAVSTFPVFSPVSGTVTGVYVREGDQVTRGQHLMDVADLSTVWLTVFLTEDQAGLVGPGQSAGFTLDAHPGVEYSGTVESVVPFLDGPGGSAEARVTLPNPAGDLLPGQTAAVTFTGSGYGSVLSVPRNSVLSLGERSLVYVLTAPLSYPEPDEGRLRIEEARFEPREVVVGVLSTDAEGNRYYPVLQGLEQGDVVALDGAFLIDSQAELTGLPSLLDPDGRG